METFWSHCTSLLILHALIWYVVSVRYKRNDVADLAWGAGGAACAMYVLIQFHPAGFGVLIPVLIMVWGMRLAVYLFLRNRGKAEDYRYRQWRESWGRWFVVRSFLQIFVLQTLLLAVIVLPPLYMSYSRLDVWSWVSWVGLIFWITGFYFQVAGDWQLSHFIRHKPYPGAILQSGVWRYTRHPNYFGELMMWWGLFFIVVPVQGAWWTIISPLTITGLILFVSGIPLLEKKYAHHPEYLDYKRRTNALVPWWPKS